MREGLNKIFCGTDVKNTGVCECFFDPKLITGAILVPRSRVFTSTELLDANIRSTLMAATLTSKGSRIFPIQNFVNITPNTEDPTRQTFGYGSIRTVREGNYDWLFQFYQGGLNLSNALRTFNGLTGKYGIIFVESQNHLIGTSRQDANGNWGLAGVPMEDIYTRPWNPSDGSNTAAYQVQLTFKPAYINENIAFKKVDVSKFMLSELSGLEDIKLTIQEVDGATVTILADSDCGSTDLFEEFADELNLAGAWQALDVDGNPLTLTVAKNNAASGWDLTLTTGVWEDEDTISLVSPEQLALPPIDLVGYESNVVELALQSSS